MDSKKQKRSYVVLIMLTLLAAGALLRVNQAAAQEALKQQVLVDEARLTLKNFMDDPNMDWFRRHLNEVKGVLIVPALYKGGFFLGGSGGKGVLLVRDPGTGEWSEPAFYTLGAVSFGIQFGGQKAEVIMNVMTRKGLESLYSSSFKLGGDATVAAGPVGTGAQRDVLADIISFVKGKGAFVGFSLEGAVVKIDEDSNLAYYKKAVKPTDIIVKKEVSNPGSGKLRDDLKQASK
jgi:lipid-binding SYLF domain-containing protein